MTEVDISVLVQAVRLAGDLCEKAWQARNDAEAVVAQKQRELEVARNTFSQARTALMSAVYGDKEWGSLW